MKNVIKNAAAAILFLLCFIFMNTEANADEGYDDNEISDELLAQIEESPDESLYLDENGVLWFVTDDAKRGTRTFYRTRGFTVFRCIPGTKTPTGESFIIPVDEPYHQYDYVADNGKTRVRAYFQFDETLILNKARAVSESWYQEIIDGKENIYLKFDGIMVVCRETVTSEGVSRVSESGEIMLDSNGNIVDTTGLYFNANDLMYNSGVNWSSGTGGVESHFNKFFMYVRAHEEVNTDTTYGDVTVTTLTMETRNESTTGEFNLKDGIPTSEQITNHIKVDEWYADYSYAKGVESKTYYLNVRFYFTYFKISVIEGNIVATPVANTGFISQRIPVTRTAYYYYLTALSVQDLKETHVNYETFLNDDLIYNNSKNIPVTALTASGSEFIDLTNAANKDFNLNRTLTEEEIAMYVTYPQIDTLNISVDATAGKIFFRMQDAVDYANNYAMDYGQDVAEAHVGYMSARSDSLVVNGFTIMDGSMKTGNKFGYTEAGIPYFTMNHNDKQQSSQTFTIAKYVENGIYGTKINAIYEEVAPATGKLIEYTSGEYSNSKYISDMTQEPILVHTPVISPITIEPDDKDKIQLVNNNINMYHLLLDGTYTLKFSAAKHLQVQGYNTDEEDPARFDEYVRSKEAKFPFIVRIGNVYYEPNTWITVGNETVFYVPTWAKESEIYTIDVRVVAENAPPDFSSEDTANLDYNNYVATYSVSCDVSGSLYGFSIAGINDALTFLHGPNSTESDRRYIEDVSFFAELEQKVVGGNNRFGNPYIRLSNGEIIEAWKPGNTLPLSDGSSSIWPRMGVISKGSKLSFVVKTIGEYWGSTDCIYIKPTYRYITEEGQVIENINLYYHEWYTMENFFWEYGSDKDLRELRALRLNNFRFKGAYTDADLDFMIHNYHVPYYGINPLRTLVQDVDINSYCLSHIIVTDQLMLYTGKEEELEVNQSKPSSEIKALVLDDETEVAFTKSMQTWFGEYTVPDNLFVTDGDVDLYEYIDEQGGGIKYNDDIFYKGGYLVLNFDIYACKDNEYYLTYMNGNNNMWQTEGARKVAYANGMEIQLRDGDVAIIDCSERLSDDIHAEYLFIY